MIGRTIGKYKIVEAIGRGGMGVVYRGLDETLDRPVAIKALHPDLADDDQVRRFRAEAVTLARVSHPNIATVYELLRDGDQLLMVMELVRGETFERLLARGGPLPIDRAVPLIAQTLDALGHAHRAGIVHRDLKPANLMLTEDGSVKVMDFGIARVRGTERVTTDGLMLGTPAYMAPEQVRGDDVDERTDLYALGIVFYRMVTGALPFSANTPVAMIHSHLHDAPTPARQVRRELPEWIDTVLMKALSKQPGDRFQTAEVFRGALAHTGPAGAPPVDRWTPVSRANDPDVTVLTPTPAAAPPPVAAGATPATGTANSATVVLDRLHIAFAGTVIALLLAIIAVLAWLALRPSRDAASPPRAASASDSGSSSASSPAVVPPVAPAVTPPPRQAPTQDVAPAAVPTPTPPAVTLPAIPSAESIKEEVARGLREAFGEVGAPPARGPAVAPSSSGPVVTPVETLVMLGGRGRLLPSTLTFGAQGIDVANPNTGVTVRSIPYGSIQHVTASRSPVPRGAGGVELPMPMAQRGPQRGNLEGRGLPPRLWMVFEAGDQRLVLRLNPPQVGPIMRLVTERINVPVERFDVPRSGPVW